MLNGRPTAVAETDIIAPARKAEEESISDVVHEDQPRPAYLLQLVVQGQPDTGSNGCADKGPAQDGQQISNQQPYQKIKRTDARCQEKRTDHEFRARNVFAAVHADETAPVLEIMIRNGLSLEL